MAAPPVPSMMRAAVLEEFNTPYQIRELSTPPMPAEHDILVRVLAASYCHTDAVFCSGAMSQDLPRIGCHEFSGEITALGPNVDPSLGLRLGQKVGVPGRAYHPCGDCYECTNNFGDPSRYSPFCPKSGNLGLTRDGGFQDYCIVDSKQVAPMPDTLTCVETAPLMCAGLTIWTALHKPEVRDAKIIAISGAGGGLGHLGVQFAAKLGKKVLAIDTGKKALALLTQIVKGLEEDERKNVTIVDARSQGSEEVLKSIGDEKAGQLAAQMGVDAVFVLPEVQAAFDYGVQLLRNHGTMIVISFPENGFNVSAKDLVYRDIRVLGSLTGRNRGLRDMLKFAGEHGVRAKIKTFPLEKINDLVAEYHKAEGGKLVIDMCLGRE